MLALVAPGQGSQTPGMFVPWLDLPVTADLLAGFSELTGLDLLRLGTTAAADEIKDTAVTQPLIVALSLLVADQLDLPDTVIDAGRLVVAGHSVGEVTAAALAGVISRDVAVSFAAHRGAEMAAACALSPTGMSAVLGGDPDEVLATIARHNLTPANRNGAGQTVAAGPLPALAALADDPPAGARVRPLAVAGAFHTRFMDPAEQALAAYSAALAVNDPVHPLLSNADGAAMVRGAQVLDRLVAQVTQPVRWDLCQRAMGRLQVTALLELAPAGALTGMAKRELPGVELLAIKSPADLDRARALIAAHTVAAQHAQSVADDDADPAGSGGAAGRARSDIVSADAASARRTSDDGELTWR